MALTNSISKCIILARLKKRAFFYEMKMKYRFETQKQ